MFSLHLSISILDCGRRVSKAKDLVKGDLLETGEGTTQTIDEIKVPKHVNVNNFKIKDYHSYYVSNLGVWTHNSCEFKRKKVNGKTVYQRNDIE
ncbi:polymorphic toxin-type HINT domain-containing protein [Peribacillus sp. B2I2]|uniref:polymorphic toxin-type HINT domain-containing protein n=1 Tax=Peribacillus sp. B2I2 TaxID=3156468 RepID=UPI003515E8D1